MLTKLNPKTSLVAVGILAIVLLVVFSFMAVRRHSLGDACTAHDRAINNCVPAFGCTPLDYSHEAAVDCVTKNYDHKFNAAL